MKWAINRVPFLMGLSSAINTAAVSWAATSWGWLGTARGQEGEPTLGGTLTEMGTWPWLSRRGQRKARCWGPLGHSGPAGECGGLGWAGAHLHKMGLHWGKVPGTGHLASEAILSTCHCRLLGGSSGLKFLTRGTFLCNWDCFGHL